MSNWDDDFWSDGDENDTGVAPVIRPTNIDRPAPSRSPAEAANVERAPSPISPVPSTVENHAGNSGWAWSTLAAKVTSSAADLILLPEDRLGQDPTRQEMAKEPQSGSWFSTVAAVLDDVKASASQSGRELFQVASEAIDSVKVPVNIEHVASEAFDSVKAHVRFEHDHFNRHEHALPVLSNTSQLLQAGDLPDNEQFPDVSIPDLHNIPSPLSVDSPIKSISQVRSAKAIHPDVPTSAATQNWRTPAEPVLTSPNSTHPSSKSSNSSTEFLAPDDAEVTVDSSWFHDVFDEMKLSAGQSGLEILQAGQSFTSEALETTKILVSSTLPGLSAQGSSPDTQQPLAVESYKLGETVAQEKRHVLGVESSRKASPVYHRQSDAGDVDRNQVDEVDDIIDSFLSNADRSPSPRPEVGHSPRGCSSPQHPRKKNVEPVLNDNHCFPDSNTECFQEAFDDIYEADGGNRAMARLESVSRESFIALQRWLPQCDDGQRATVDQVKSLLDDLTSLSDDQPNSLLVELQQLIVSCRSWHKQVLRVHLGSGSCDDISELCAKSHSLTTRSMALLSSKIVTKLAEIVDGWQSGHVDVLVAARALRQFFHSFTDELHQIMEMTLSSVRLQECFNDQYADDVDVLQADIELDASEAQCRIEDIIEALIPVLQYLHGSILR
uniref:Uncharacterized protein n=1 Tax=Spongospora subterranea TaxID=70186 RepID=A0A0H5R8Z9_9EUKA|eukprot:CRZ10600.1 hypothetical protein [Spongospora subterranea]